MNLDPINTADDENYSNYDNRPIRPMDQDALNEALARLPILIDEGECIAQLDPSTSLKTRRQPTLAYSTKRKDHETPMNNKRKMTTGNTPITVPSVKKLIKRRSKEHQQEISQLKETNINLQIECEVLKQTSETMNTLITEHRIQSEQLQAALIDRDQSLHQLTNDINHLRADHSNLTLEKESMAKIINENEMTIKKLREEMAQMKENQQQKPNIHLSKGRMPLKESTSKSQSLLSVDQTRTIKTGLLHGKDLSRSKLNTKTPLKREPIVARDEVFQTPSMKSVESLPGPRSIDSSLSTKQTALTKVKVKPKVIIDAQTRSKAKVFAP